MVSLKQLDYVWLIMRKSWESKQWPSRKMVSCAIFVWKQFEPSCFCFFFLAGWDSLIEWVVSAGSGCSSFTHLQPLNLLYFSVWVNVQRGVMACSMAAFNLLWPEQQRKTEFERNSIWRALGLVNELREKRSPSILSELIHGEGRGSASTSRGCWEL